MIIINNKQQRLSKNMLLWKCAPSIWFPYIYYLFPASSYYYSLALFYAFFSLCVFGIVLQLFSPGARFGRAHNVSNIFSCFSSLCAIIPISSCGGSFFTWRICKHTHTRKKYGACWYTLNMKNCMTMTNNS